MINIQLEKNLMVHSLYQLQILLQLLAALKSYPFPRHVYAAAIERLCAAGARVVALGDCVVCHTANDGKPFAGFPVEFVNDQSPLGGFYSNN